MKSTGPFVNDEVTAAPSSVGPIAQAPAALLRPGARSVDPNADPLVQLLARRASGGSDALVEGPSGGASAAAIVAESERLAGELARLGLAPDSVVGLAAVNGAAFLAGFCALRRCGLVALMLDAATPRGEQERVLERLGAAAVLRAKDRWEGRRWSAGSELAGLAPAAPRTVAGACALKLTSGSTGKPRGIAVSAEALLADGRALWKSMELRADDRYLALVPMSHSYGFSVLTLPALLGEGALVLPEDEDPLGVALKYRASVLPSTPAWYDVVSKLSTPPRWPATLRLLLSAGAPLTAPTARAFRERFGQRVHAFYGSSESGGISYDRIGDAAERGSVGTPVAGVRIELVPGADGHAGNEREGSSQAGLVRAHSAAVASGYVPATAADQARLGGGAYRTDDSARFVDGELVLLGRQGDWINVRGKKVHPREVEAVLAQLPGVDAVAVFGAAASGDAQVVRAIIACVEGRLGYRDVLDWCRSRLASHKLPRSLVFVRALPRTPRGKLDRAALRALTPHGAGAPADG